MEDFDTHSDMLSEMIQDNIDNPDQAQIEKIRAFWDGEKWDSIVAKFETEGSTWYVWWTDGVQAYVQSLR